MWDPTHVSTGGVKQWGPCVTIHINYDFMSEDVANPGNGVGQALWRVLGNCCTAHKHACMIFHKIHRSCRSGETLQLPSTKVIFLLAVAHQRSCSLFGSPDCMVSWPDYLIGGVPCSKSTALQRWSCNLPFLFLIQWHFCSESAAILWWMLGSHSQGACTHDFVPIWAFIYRSA